MVVDQHDIRFRHRGLLATARGVPSAIGGGRKTIPIEGLLCPRTAARGKGSPHPISAPPLTGRGAQRAHPDPRGMRGLLELQLTRQAVSGPSSEQTSRTMAEQGIRKCALGTNGVPNARAESGGPATGPCAAGPKWAEPSDPVGGARTSHGIHLGMPRSRNAAVQPDRVKGERSAGRKNAAAVYSKANLDGSAMAAGSGGDHAPVSIDLGRNCWRGRTRDCGSGR